MIKLTEIKPNRVYYVKDHSKWERFVMFIKFLLNKNGKVKSKELW